MREHLRYYWEIYAMGVTVSIFISLCMYSAVLSERAWVIYAAERHCAPIGTYRGPRRDQIIYRCDGGEMQIR